MRQKMIILILDSVGVGASPDAEHYGDIGADTLGHIIKEIPTLNIPNLSALGLDILYPQWCSSQYSIKHPFHYCVGKMQESSKGKDTVTGHWEIAGVITETPFPTYPNGFSSEFLQLLSEETGYSFIGNEVASGTEIIQRLGQAHLDTQCPIIYTSADSVLQIAAHEQCIPLETLYKICEKARELSSQQNYVIGRIIARPFQGTAGNFYRTVARKDYALDIPQHNVLSSLLAAQIDVIAIGKISDIFTGVSFTESRHTKNNEQGMSNTMQAYQKLKHGLILTNLVDFDMNYGHRRDIYGYGHALEQFDMQLGKLLQQIDDDTLIVITSDHGCDPTFIGTDHTREYVPLFVVGSKIKHQFPLGIRTSFTDLAETIAQYFNIKEHFNGCSFYQDIIENT